MSFLCHLSRCLFDPLLVLIQEGLSCFFVEGFDCFCLVFVSICYEVEIAVFFSEFIIEFRLKVKKLLFNVVGFFFVAFCFQERFT